MSILDVECRNLQNAQDRYAEGLRREAEELRIMNSEARRDYLDNKYMSKIRDANSTKMERKEASYRIGKLVEMLSILPFWDSQGKKI